MGDAYASISQSHVDLYMCLGYLEEWNNILVWLKYSKVFKADTMLAA